MDAYQQALSVMSATPATLRAILAATPSDALTESPAPDSWSPLRILGHLLYVETVIIGPRVRLMLEQDDPVYPPGPPESETRGAEAILSDWLAAREENLAFLRALTPEQLERTGQHERYGRISVREHVVEWAYHDLDHLRQLMAALQTRLYPDIGGFKAIYPPPQV